MQFSLCQAQWPCCEVKPGSAWRRPAYNSHCARHSGPAQWPREVVEQMLREWLRRPLHNLSAHAHAGEVHAVKIACHSGSPCLSPLSKSAWLLTSSSPSRRQNGRNGRDGRSGQDGQTTLVFLSPLLLVSPSSHLPSPSVQASPDADWSWPRIGPTHSPPEASRNTQRKARRTVSPSYCYPCRNMAQHSESIRYTMRPSRNQTGFAA